MRPEIIVSSGEKVDSRGRVSSLLFMLFASGCLTLMTGSASYAPASPVYKGRGIEDC